MTEPLKIALAGLGTVGTGVIRLIETNARDVPSDSSKVACTRSFRDTSLNKLHASGTHLKSRRTEFDLSRFNARLLLETCSTVPTYVIVPAVPLAAAPVELMARMSLKTGLLIRAVSRDPLGSVARRVSRRPTHMLSAVVASS